MSGNMPKEQNLSAFIGLEVALVKIK